MRLKAEELNDETVLRAAEDMRWPWVDVYDGLLAIMRHWRVRGVISPEQEQRVSHQLSQVDRLVTAVEKRAAEIWHSPAPRP